MHVGGCFVPDKDGGESGCDAMPVRTRVTSVSDRFTLFSGVPSLSCKQTL